jgi:tetratricopeptide (TPR) repeat protein
LARTLNYLIALFAAALVACGAYLAYTHIWQDEPIDPAYQRSLDAWEQAVRDNPDNALARANLGATYLEVGRTDDAIEQLKTALDMEPDSFSYMLQLGYAYNAQGDYGSAFDMFVKSADNTPEHEKYVAYYEAAVAAQSKGDNETAKDYANKSIEDNDTLWNPHLLLGQLYEQDGDNEKALAEYQAAAQFNPDDRELKQDIERLSQ